jgi:predicted dehydrogenase
MPPSSSLRFAAIGLNHIHIYEQVGTLMQAGAEFAAFYSREPEIAEGFGKLFPQPRRAADPREILEDRTIQLVTSATIPDERARLGIEVMQHGKDFLVDKPGAVTLEELEELRRVQDETGQIWAIFFSERLASPATERALELVRSGAIGRPLQTVGFGPHRLGLTARPEWFYQPARTGGILADLASHQTDQFLMFTASESADVVAATVANYAHPERPELEDFGELLLRSDHATGSARVDWFTPEGLETWGDVRLMVLGTEGTIEVRKNCDPAGRPGGDHLILIDAEGTRHFDCSQDPLSFGPTLLYDIAGRTEEALPQAHCFRAMELALKAQARATRCGYLA